MEEDVDSGFNEEEQEQDIQEYGFKKEPFRKYSLEDKEKETISLKLNAQERRLLDEIKEELNVDRDGTALKKSAWIGHKVLQAVLGKEILEFLTEERRVRQREKKKKVF